MNKKLPWILITAGLAVARVGVRGFDQLFALAESLTAVRNPKAHSNVVIDEKRARHFVYLASLLAHRFDDRVGKRATASYP